MKMHCGAAGSWVGMRVALLLLGGMMVWGQSGARAQEQGQAAAPAGTPAAAVRTLSADEKAELLKQADAAQAAFNRGDGEVILQISHPAVIKMYGGPEAMTKLLRAAMAQMDQMGAKYLSTEFGEPTQVYPAGKEMVCFVPRRSLIQIGAKKVKSLAYWVAARPVDSAEWKFIDGAGIHSSQEMLWTFFPELQRDVQLPEWKMEVVAP